MSMTSKLVNWSIDVVERQIVGGRKKSTWHLTGIEYDDLLMTNGKYVYTVPIKNMQVNHNKGTVDIFTENMHFHNTLAEMSSEENHMRACVLFIDEPLHDEGLTIYFDLNNVNLFDRMYCKNGNEITYSFGCFKSQKKDKVTVKCAGNYIILCVTEQEGMHFKMIANTTVPHIYAANVGKRELQFSCAGKEYILKYGESTAVEGEIYDGRKQSGIKKTSRINKLVANPS